MSSISSTAPPGPAVDPTAEPPLEYTLEHLAAALANAPEVAETDVVLEAEGDRLVVNAHVPTEERRQVLLAAIAARWHGEVDDRIEVLATMTADRRSAR
jgi:hypothetical protein